MRAWRSSPLSRFSVPPSPHPPPRQGWTTQGWTTGPTGIAASPSGGTRYGCSLGVPIPSITTWRRGAASLWPSVPPPDPPRTRTTCSRTSLTPDPPRTQGRGRELPQVSVDASRAAHRRGVLAVRAVQAAHVLACVGGVGAQPRLHGTPQRGHRRRRGRTVLQRG